jgi:hypothetical protein
VKYLEIILFQLIVDINNEGPNLEPRSTHEVLIYSNVILVFNNLSPKSKEMKRFESGRHLLS